MVNNDKLQVMEKIIRDKKASDAHIVLRKKKHLLIQMSYKLMK